MRFMQDVSSCSPTLFPSCKKFNGECYLMPYIGSIALTRLPVFLSIPPRSLPRWTGKIFFLIAPVLFLLFSPSHRCSEWRFKKPAKRYSIYVTAVQYCIFYFEGILFYLRSNYCLRNANLASVKLHAIKCGFFQLQIWFWRPCYESFQLSSLYPNCPLGGRKGCDQDWHALKKLSRDPTRFK